MLVLTRKKGESIIVGDNVEVKILELHSGQVKIGIQAPQHIAIHRKEVYEAIQRENRLASASPAKPPDDIADLFQHRRRENK